MVYALQSYINELSDSCYPLSTKKTQGPMKGRPEARESFPLPASQQQLLWQPESFPLHVSGSLPTLSSLAHNRNHTMRKTCIKPWLALH